jgi:multiple sugar transport system permease protein
VLRGPVPGVVTVLLFTSVATWNHHFLPLITLNDPELFPITVGISAWSPAGGVRA